MGGEAKVSCVLCSFLDWKCDGAMVCSSAIPSRRGRVRAGRWTVVKMAVEGASANRLNRETQKRVGCCRPWVGHPPTSTRVSTPSRYPLASQEFETKPAQAPDPLTHVVSTRKSLLVVANPVLRAEGSKVFLSPQPFVCRMQAVSPAILALPTTVALSLMKNGHDPKKQTPDLHPRP
ncbi:hypothetical protein BR93DRAFT_255564 [Coniochaeta sp. PMI_546]|nr:hypothetical protein BR93DRAFT_255564 [Coniochaeta sp. PMI_546]